MNKKNLILVSGLFIFFIIATASVFNWKPFRKSKQSIIRIGYMDWAGFYPLLIANKNGKFENKEYKISLFKAKDNGELNSMISTGKVDLAYGAFADHIYMKGNDVPIKFIYASDFSKSDVIVADSSVNSLKDLENKKISVTDLNSFSEFFVLTTLQTANINTRKLNLKIIDFDKVTSEISKKNINAGHTWDPETEKAKALGYKVIASSEDIKGIVIDGLIATEDILNKNKNEIADILYEINKSQETLKKLEKEDIDFLSTHFNSPYSSIKHTIEKGVEYLNLEENKKLFESDKDYSLSFWTRKISEFYTSRGQLNKTLNVQSILDNSAVLIALQRGVN